MPEASRPELPNLGEFLRSRRTRRGLIQKELARRVGVSSSYIQQMEQNRAGVLGDSVIANLSDQLRLSPDEVAHLEVLAGHSPRPDYRTGTGSASLAAALLDALEPNAAAFYRGWRVLEANNGFHDLWPGLADAPSVLDWMFGDRRARRVFPDWTAEAHRAVAYFRGYAAHPDTRTPAREVLAEAWVYPEFRTLWREGGVRVRANNAPRDVLRNGLEVSVREVMLPWTGYTAGDVLYLGLVTARVSSCRSA
jgi:transcriptional regulator with XRE-family HTH domain